ncbi:MAG: lipopolysaccharide biosynthesis protein, partial [Verrucomicrobiaceae bacterium]
MAPEAKDALGAPIRKKIVGENPAVSPGVDMADLKRKSVRGGAVTVASQVVSIGIQLTSTVVLARLLVPEDYGIMAMVMAVTSFVGLFRDMGLSSAAIQRKEITSAQQNNLFWLNVALGTILMILVSAMAPLVVWFYDKPELKWVTVALSLGFLIGALGAQHSVALVRNLQFGRQAAVSIATAVTSLIVSVSLAYVGYSYWALVWGSLAGPLLGTILLFVLSPFHVGWFSKNAGTKAFLGFGATVTGSSIASYLYRSLDNILLGKFWGAQELGLYSRGYSLLMLPITADFSSA